MKAFIVGDSLLCARCAQGSGDVAGEVDVPHHCDTCSAPLTLPLTTDGLAFVRSTLADYCRGGAGNASTLEAWLAAYGEAIDPNGAKRAAWSAALHRRATLERRASAFAHGWLGAALFSTNAAGSDCTLQDYGYTMEDWDDNAWRQATSIGRAFLRAFPRIGRGRVQWEEAAGTDAWFTAEGHGCGFWDGGWPEPEASATKAWLPRSPSDELVATAGRLSFR